MAINRWFAVASLGLIMLFAEPARSQTQLAALNLPDSPSASPLPLPQDSNSTAAAAAQTEADERAKAEIQLKAQEKQRVFGVMASFNTTRNKDALPLSTGQKYQLFFKSVTDPWPFVLTAFSAGIDQAENSFPAYGQGAQGYAKRFGADYTDYFTGNFFGNAVLASILKEDPRYFQKGTGSFTGRALWAASSTVWAKRDNGTWGPNYANVVGNLMGSAMSNLYYPASDRTVSGTVERGITVTAEAIVGSEVIEFWPDLVRRHQRKMAEKLAKQGLGPNALPPAIPPPPVPQR